MKEYDIFIPLFYNDGSPIEPEKLWALQDRLVEEFKGLTFFPHPNEGFWRMGEVTYRDKIVIHRVFAVDTVAARQFLVGLKEDLKRDFRQEEILIIARDVEAL